MYNMIYDIVSQLEFTENTTEPTRWWPVGLARNSKGIESHNQKQIKLARL